MKESFSAKEIIKICNGTLYSGSEDTICKSFTQDTRKIKRGDTYIGIKGSNFDGNTFYLEAFEKGANCVILEKDYIEVNKPLKNDKTIIVVNNSLEALKDLALEKRNNSEAKFIGVTGSVGKTSTRDMIYSVLSTNFKTLKTEGNLNNNIGLPFTLLRLTNEQAAVIEMGMNHLGEIDYLTNIVKPHISVITNVGTAHIGELGSRENILKAKLEIINGMNEEGKLIINNDNDLLHDYYKKNKKGVITIGIDNESDFTAIDLNLKENSSDFKIKYQDNFYLVHCPIPGISFVYNSLVAFAVGTLLKIEVNKIIEGIANFELTKNRMEIIHFQNNLTIINDAYNASVDSMKSSLSVLSKYKTRKVAVLGDMLELGDYSIALHKEVGKEVVNNKIDILITIGSSAKYIASQAKELGQKEIYSYDNLEEAKEFINILKENDTILFKASNGMKFINLINYLKEVYK